MAIVIEEGYILSPYPILTCFGHHDILAKTRSRMTTAITLSRQNDSGSRAHTTQNWEILVLVLKSEGLY